MRYHVTICVLVLGSCVGSAWCADASVPAIRLLAVKPKPNAYRPHGWTQPVVIRDQDQAAEYFQKDELAKLLNEVKFEEQVVVAFAWRGSGQDRLDYNVLEIFPEQVVFEYSRGRTKDLRRNARVFALRQNVTWKTVEKQPTPPPSPTAGGDYIKIEMRGRLNSQVNAIGGETTGFEITADGAKFELDFSKTPSMRRQAVSFHGKTVIVLGKLQVRSGVEVARRWIITVDTLSRVEDHAAENPYLTADGKLRSGLTLRESQTGFAGESGDIWEIATDGTWRHRTFLNKDLSVPDRQGRLNRMQLRELAQQMDRSNLLRLPQQLGRDPGVNPKVVSLTYGNRQITLTLPGGTDLQAELRTTPKSPKRSFLTLVMTILDCT